MVVFVSTQTIVVFFIYFFTLFHLKVIVVLIHSAFYESNSNFSFNFLFLIVFRYIYVYNIYQDKDIIISIENFFQNIISIENLSQGVLSLRWCIQN